MTYDRKLTPADKRKIKENILKSVLAAIENNSPMRGIPKAARVLTRIHDNSITVIIKPVDEGTTDAFNIRISEVR